MLLSINCLAQYGPLTSNYMFNGMYINPAYTGSLDAFATDLTYRNQWGGVEGAPESTIFSAHMPLKKEQISVGALLFNNSIGVKNSTSIYFNGAYRIKSPSKNTLALGLSGGLDFINENWSNVVTTEANDGQFSTPQQHVLPNFSFGAYWYGKRFFIGASAPFFLQRRYSDLGAVSISQDFSNSTYMFEGGYNFDLNSNVKLKPSFLLKMIPAQQQQLDLNLLAEFNKTFGIGGSYRTNAAVVGLFYINLFEKNLTISYAYDHAIGTNVNYLGSSHEIYLRYVFKKVVNLENPRYF